MNLGRIFIEALRLDRWTGDEVRARALGALELQVAGFLLFGGEAEDVSRLTSWLREKAARPLLMASDMERGAGQQVRGGAHLPPPAALAAHPQPEEIVATAARLTACEATDLGINWILAPVLDLDVEPRNPIVGTRSFGSDPDKVARLGAIWVGACQSQGVAACAKHFPGHGRTIEDSHVELPKVRASRETLEQDLLPFRQVVDSVATMMTAHVAYPSLGVPGPATLSETILRDLLRVELGFEGLVVSDALVMEGFQAPKKDGVRIVEGSLAARAVAAGCDLLLYPRDLARAVTAMEVTALADAAVAEAATDAIRRVQNVARLFDASADRHEDFGEEGKAGVRRGSKGDGTESLGGGCETATLPLALDSLSAAGAVSELTREQPTEILCFGHEAEVGAETTRAGRVFASELTSLGWHVVSVKGLDPAIPPTDGKERRHSLRRDRRAEVQRIVLVYWTPRAWRGRGELPPDAVRVIREALSGARGAWVVVLGHPRILSQIGVPGLCAWSGESLMERAAARWLDARV